VLWLIVFALGFPFLVLMDGLPDHLLQLNCGSLLAFTVSAFLTKVAGTSVAAWCGSFAVGLMSNLYGRVTGNPSIEMAFMSILMLVPGSLGVRSVLASSSDTTFEFLVQMMSVAVSIVTGLLAANLFLPPARVLML